jgi:hypothetical protein
MISVCGNVWQARDIPDSTSWGASLPVDWVFHLPSISLTRHFPQMPFPPHEATRYTPCLLNAWSKLSPSKISSTVPFVILICILILSQDIRYSLLSPLDTLSCFKLPYSTITIYHVRIPMAYNEYEVLKIFSFCTLSIIHYYKFKEITP